MTKSKTKIMSLIFALLLCFGTLFASVANRTLNANAEAKTVTQVSGSLYEDSDHNKYFKQKVFGNDSVNTLFENIIVDEESNTNCLQLYWGNTALSNGEKVLDSENGIKGQDRFFAYEPIVWKVLSVDENGIAFLVSDKVLANMAFQPTVKVGDDDKWYTSANGANDSNTYANVYEYSNVRYWLNSISQNEQTGSMTDSAGAELDSYLANGIFNHNQLGLSTDLGYPTFLQTAFSSSGQSKIKISSGIGASDATTYVEAESGDKVFLLSYSDVFDNATYFADNSARIKKTTDLAKATYTLDGEFMDPTYCGAWWLRSPDSTDSYIADYVFFDGSAYSGTVSNLLFGVVPAMYLDTSDMPELKAYSDSACTSEVSTGKLTAENGTNHNYIQFGSWPQTVADVTESAEGGSSGSGAGSGSEVSSTGVDINLIGLYFGMGAVAVSAMAITSVLNKTKRNLKSEKCQNI